MNLGIVSVLIHEIISLKIRVEHVGAVQEAEVLLPAENRVDMRARLNCPTIGRGSGLWVSLMGREVGQGCFFFLSQPLIWFGVIFRDSTHLVHGIAMAKYGFKLCSHTCLRL